MDVLADVLSTIELTAQLYFQAIFRAPFAVAVPADRRRIRFHIASTGRSWIGLPTGEEAFYGDGDLILVPHGSAHVLADGPHTAPRPLEQVIAEVGFNGQAPLEYGGGGAHVVIVCGHLAFDEAMLHPIVASLPPLIHVRADEVTNFGWMEQVLRHIERESQARRTGYREVVRRLSEILLIEVLRARADSGGLGAVSALVDPQLGRALQALHAEPEAEWSLERLARVAGQSRTLFVQRFRERMGMPPMKYLAAWRLLKARSLLAHWGGSVAEVARRVGYASESAFNRAFRDQFGAPPGTFRRRTGT